MRRGQYDVVKIVTGWGIVGDNNGGIHNPRIIEQICDLTRYTIVRTVTGDGPRGDGVIDPNEVPGEIDPWYTAKKASRFGAQGLIIELGNEANVDPVYRDACVRNDTNAKRSFMQRVAAQLNVAIDRAMWYFNDASRNGAWILGTSLSPHQGWDPTLALEVLAPTLNRCHLAAVHMYTDESWIRSPDADFMIPLYKRSWNADGPSKYGNKKWVLSEYGIGSRNLDNPDKETRGRRNAGFLHSTILPSNTWGGTVYHLHTEYANNREALQWELDHNKDRRAYEWYYPEGDTGYARQLGR